MIMPTTTKETESVPKITVIDAIMGTGKSTFLINEIINKNPQKRFICVLPTLDECARYTEKVKATTYEPKPYDGRKLVGLQKLIADNRNIVTTHALIQYIDEITMDLLKNSNYTLIIDECLDVVHEYKRKFSKSDVKSILHDEYAKPDEKGYLVWNDQKEKEVFHSKYQGRWDDIRRLCKLRSLMCLPREDGTFSTEIIIWNFPVRFFELFEKCYISTYLWAGSFQKSYFDMHKVEYRHTTLENGKLCEYDRSKEKAERMNYFRLINLYNDSLNNIGVPKKKNENPLCESWYRRKAKTEEGILILTQLKIIQ